MRNSRRKNRRARAASSDNPNNNNNKGDGDGDGGGGGGEECKEVRDVRCLAEAFSLVSLDDVCSAYKEAQGDLNKAADILGGLLMNDDDPSSSSERFFGSTSSSSEGFFWSTSEDPPTSSNLSSCSSERLFDSDVVQMPATSSSSSKGFGGSKHKRVIASTGTVSTVLGKSYASSSPMDGGSKQYNSPSKWKEPLDFSAGNNEEAERFLFSMLGDGCELSMAVVRDVFSHCGYDIEKASDALLDLSASSYDQRKYSNQNGSCKRVSNILTECNSDVDDTVGRYQFPGTVSDSNFHLFEKEVQDVLQFWDHERKYSEVLLGPKKHSQSRPVTTEANLPQKILDSLFNVPKSSEVKPESMNWKNVVKKIESLGERLNTQSTGGPSLQENTEYVKGEEYHVFREAAKQHWQKMRSYHQKAATAYSRGEKDYAVYLSEQAKVQNKMAREADEKASKDIFEARNKEIKNVLTIDLHGQHVKQAIRVLKIHLLFMMCTASVQLLRVITGCGSHGYGKGKLKQMVINLAEKAGVEWCEENQGTVVIKLDGRRDLNFADFESDTE